MQWCRDPCNSTVGNTVVGPCRGTWEDKAKELQVHELAFKRLTLIQLDALCMQGELDQLKPLPLHLGEQLEPLDKPVQQLTSVELDELNCAEGALVLKGSLWWRPFASGRGCGRSCPDADRFRSSPCRRRDRSEEHPIFGILCVIDDLRDAGLSGK